MHSASHITTVFMLVGLIVGIFIVIAASKAHAKKRRERRKMLQMVAVQLGGTVIPGSFFKQPNLAFEHLGHPASLEFYSTGGKNPTYYTHLIFNFSSNPPFELHIYPERLFSKLGKLLGGQDIQIGDEIFDARFMIKGSSPERVKSMLATPGVREALFELRSLKMNDHIDLATKRYALRIQKLSWLDAPDLLLKFASSGKLVFEAYLEVTGQAVFEERAAPSTAEPERCAVCGDVIEGSSRSCPRCGAAHHPECYELNDGCGRCG